MLRYQNGPRLICELANKELCDPKKKHQLRASDPIRRFNLVLLTFA